MKYFFILLTVFVFVHAGCYTQRYSKSWNDINYANDTMQYHSMDIYLPEVTKKSYPIIIVIYGSAWLSNNLKKDAFKTLGEPLLDSGFAVVAVNHRSSKDAVFPAQINDIKAAVRFIRANAIQYQLDTSFIGITGYSSGGHLSSLTGTSGHVKKFRINSDSAQIEGNIGKYTSYSSSVDAVVDWFGPTNFLLMDSCGSRMNHNAPDSPESLLIGGPIQQNADKCALADPVTYIDSKDPPFLILHGDADPLVPYCESERFFKALQQKNVSSQFVLVPNAKHGDGLFYERYFKMMSSFFIRESKKHSLQQ